MTTKKRVGPQAGFTIPKTLPMGSIKASLVTSQSPIFTIQKGGTTDDDGIFTKLGVDVMTKYSNGWLAGVRDLELERQYPELAGSFYDVRSDSEYARRWADDVAAPVQKALTLEESLQKAGLAPIPPKLVVPAPPAPPKGKPGKGFFEDIIG